MPDGALKIPQKVLRHVQLFPGMIDALLHGAEQVDETMSHDDIEASWFRSSPLPNSSCLGLTQDP